LNRSPVSCETVKLSPTVTGVLPFANSTVPSVGSAVTETLNCDKAKLASLGALIPIGVAPLFSPTVSDVAVVTSAALLGPIPNVALPEVVAPLGSDTL
jgi:hypothetical protein